VLALGLYADFGALVDALKQFRWALFPLALLLTFLNYVLRWVRWEVYLGRVDIRVPRGRSFVIFLAGLTMTISPAKLGEVLKSGLLRRAFDTPVRRSAPIVLAERVTDGTGVILLAALSIAWAGGAELWPLLVVVFGGLVGIVVAIRSRLLARFDRLADARAAALELLGVRLVLSMTVLAAVSWFFECLAAYVCVRGLDLDVSLVETTAVFCVASLAGAVSFLPGGLLVAEGSMTALFKRLGDLTNASAAAATVLVRLATLWFAVALGLVALAIEERRARS
jgi:glycosyltransferase 2 family protein